MATTWNPDLVSEDLVSLSHRLGDPAKDLVILAEGNASQRLDDGRVVVKASGAYMATATREEYVVTDVQPLIELIEDPSTTQEQLTFAVTALTPVFVVVDGYADYSYGEFNLHADLSP